MEIEALKMKKSLTLWQVLSWIERLQCIAPMRGFFGTQKIFMLSKQEIEQKKGNRRNEK